VSVRKIRGRSRTRRHKPSYKPVTLWTKRWFAANCAMSTTTETSILTPWVHVWDMPGSGHCVWRRPIQQYGHILPKTFTLTEALTGEYVVCMRCLRREIRREAMRTGNTPYVPHMDTGFAKTSYTEAALTRPDWYTSRSRWNALR
jgi:hypothetical protein